LKDWWPGEALVEERAVRMMMPGCAVVEEDHPRDGATPPAVTGRVELIFLELEKTQV